MRTLVVLKTANGLSLKNTNKELGFVQTVESIIYGHHSAGAGYAIAIKSNAAMQRQMPKVQLFGISCLH